MSNTRRIKPNPKQSEPAPGSRRHELRRTACQESGQSCKRHNPRRRR